MSGVPLLTLPVALLVVFGAVDVEAVVVFFASINAWSRGVITIIEWRLNKYVPENYISFFAFDYYKIWDIMLVSYLIIDDEKDNWWELSFFFFVYLFCNLSMIHYDCSINKDLTCHFVIGSSHLWSMNTHCIPVLITSSLYILSSALISDISSSIICLGLGIVYHHKHFPLQALAVYPTVLRVIAFAPIHFHSWACILLNKNNIIAISTIYNCNVTIGVCCSLIKEYDCSLLWNCTYTILSYPFGSNKGEPVCHHFKAEPENHLIGNQTSCANNFTSAMHWAQSSFDSAYLFPIHLSNTSFVVIYNI